MPRPRSLPDTEELVRLRDVEGLTYREIADQFAVTKGAVFQRFRKAGLTAEGRRYADVIPWTVREEHDQTHPIMMLRAYARRERGEQLDQRTVNMLDKWLRELRELDAVVLYDEAIPPSPVSPRSGGWAYVPRRDVDLFPISNPAVPVGGVVVPERGAPAADSCALCDQNQDLQSIKIIDSVAGLSYLTVCPEHYSQISSGLVAASAGRHRVELARTAAADLDRKVAELDEQVRQHVERVQAGEAGQGITTVIKLAPRSKPEARRRS